MGEFFVPAPKKLERPQQVLFYQAKLRPLPLVPTLTHQDFHDTMSSYSADRFALSYLKAESNEMVKKDVVESHSTHNVTYKLTLI